MRTLTNDASKLVAMVSLTFVCGNCAMVRNSRVEEEWAAKTRSTEEVIDSDLLYHSVAIEGTVLKVKLETYSRCKKRWTEQFRKVRIDHIIPDPSPCMDSALLGALLGTGFTVGGIILMNWDKEPEENETQIPGTASLLLGVTYLGWTALDRVYCRETDKEEKIDLGIVERESSGEPYNCHWSPLADLEIGIMLTSKVILSARTNDEGIAQVDLAGAETDDIKQLQLFIPQHQIAVPLKVSEQERKFLVYALTPKQGQRLAPQYREIKAQMQHAVIACYEKMFGRSSIAGNIGMAIEVAPIGRVRHLSVDIDRNEFVTINSCLWDTVSTMKFDPWEGAPLALHVARRFEGPPVVNQPPTSRHKGSSSTAHTASTPPVAKKRTETVLIGGHPVVFVRDPSLGCTAGVAACQAAVDQAGGCNLIRRETSRAIGGVWGVVAGVATGAMCDQKIQEICAQAICGE